MNDLLIGLDLGTSALKGVLVSTTEGILAEAKVATVLNRPAPSHVEFDADEHYERVCSVIRKLVEQAPAGGKVRAISMAVASGNTVLVDEDIRPIAPAFSWMDTRLADDSDAPELFNTDEVYEVTGWPAANVFPLGHLTWCMRNQPELYARASRVMMCNDYVAWRLTGCFGLDHSTGTTFHLQEQTSGTYHPPFLERLNLTEDQLSPLSPSGTVLGALTAQGASDTGLDPETLLVLGSFDHPSAARGTGVLAPGDFLLSCGTSWVGFYPTYSREVGEKNKLLLDPFLTPDGPWGCLFALPKVGSHLDFWLAEMFDDNLYERFDTAAAAAGPGAGGVRIDLLEKPTTEIVQATIAQASLSDLCRALMESLAFLTREHIERLRDAGLRADHIAMVGGPSHSKTWPQMIAEVVGVPVSLGNGQVAGAVGASILAGIGAELFKDAAEGFAQVGGKFQQIAPTPEACRIYDEIYKADRS